MKNKLLVLASSSPYRRELAARLGLPFEAVAPDIAESALPCEAPPATAQRLATAKAMALKDRFTHALIIGSDQVAVLDGQPIGKPLTHENAIEQLNKASGKELTFHTALALLNSDTGRLQEAVVVTKVRLRRLTPAQIESYLRRERPYDCAGSAKSEGLGIALIEWIRGDDPNALVGLPLIELVTMLKNEGVEVIST